jgi:phage gp29-like protein
LKLPFLNFSVRNPFSTEVRGSITNLPIRATAPADDLSDRAVNADPMGDWYLALPTKLPPKEIENILRMALAGNPWQAYQLVQRMRDSWPMFNKCCYELRSAVAHSQFVVHPYTEPGENPTDSAKAKADLVRRSLASFKPNRFAEEEGFQGLVFDLTDAVLNGVSIVELLWNENAVDPEGKREKNIRASAFVHPRHYLFRADGQVSVVQSNTAELLAFPRPILGTVATTQPQLNNPSKFMVAKFKSKSGTALGAGWMRPLAYQWAMIAYGHDFMMNFAQKYGNPFMDIPYQSGIPEPEVAKFERLAKRAANQGYCVHPNTGEIKITAAQAMGGENPIVQMKKMADENCQMLILGQNLTSTSPKQGGSRAQGDVHADIRNERIEGILRWVAGILTEQLVESLMLENYGEGFDERPAVEPDLTRPLDALEQAQFLQALSTCTVPLPLADTYKKMGISAPATGDQVLVSGKIGMLGDTETDIDANPAPPAPPTATGPDGKPLPNSPAALEKEAAQGRLSKARLRVVLANLPKEELIEISNLVTAAEKAPHHNGEATALKTRLEELTRWKP